MTTETRTETRFNRYNTAGYTDAEIATLNDALALVLAARPDADEREVSEEIGRQWQDGNSAATLAAAALRWLRA